MKKVKILAIDGNADNLKVLKALLAETFPHALFVSAQSGKSGIEMCISEKPDIALLDMVMPGMDSYDVCQILKANEETKSIPVLIVTDEKADKECRLKALESGADAFLGKPFDEVELMAQVRAMLRIKESENRKLDETERLQRLVEERTELLQKELNERKKAEGELQDSDEKYSILFMNSPDSYLIIKEGVFIDCNKATEDMLGGDRTRIIGQTPFALSPEFQPDGKKSSESAEEKITDALQNGLKTFEWVHRRFDGSDFYVEVSIAPMILNGCPTLFTTWRDITKRKISEEELKKSLSLVEATLESIHNGILVVGSDGAVIKASTRFAEMWKIPGDILASNDDQILLNYILEQLADPDGFIAKVTEVYNKPEAETLDLIHFKDGRIFERISKPVYLGGKPQGRVWSFLDITEQKLAEENLKESQQLFQGLFNASPDAIVLIDPHNPNVSWPILDCNAASCQMNGYTREEMIGQSIDILNETAGAPEDRISYFNTIRQKGVLHMESTHRRKDGHVFPIEISTSIITIGGREMVLGIDRDISARKLAEEAMRTTKKLLEQSFEQSPIPMVLVSMPGAVVRIANPACLKFLGIQDEPSVLNTRLADLKPTWQDFDLFGRPGTFEELALPKSLMGKKTENEERYIICKDGTIRYGLVNGFPIFDDEGRIIAGHLVMMDITERKQAELALKESEDRYKGFISQVSEGVYRFECDEPIDITLPVEEQIDLIYDRMYIAECNQAILKMYKMSDEKEMIGKRALDFHGGKDTPANRETFRTFIRNGYQVENAITEELNIKGQPIYVSNNSLGIIENKHLIRMWGTQTDVTEKMRFDQVQQVLFSISNAALSSINLTELIEFISKEVGKLLDSTNFYIAFYDEQTDMLSTIFERDEKDIIESWPAKNSITGYVIKQQKSVLMKDAEVQDFYNATGIEQFGTASKVWLGVPLVTNKKTIGAIVVQSYDNPDAYTEKDKLMLEFISHQISVSIERKKTEQELKLMGKVFDQSPVTIVITDKEGNIEYTNPKFSETTGYSSDEVKGKNPRILQSGHQSKSYYKNLWKTILAGKDWFGEFENIRKNGESYWESAVISPITNESGDIVFFMAIKEDITDKKKMIADLIHARNKAEESDRLKSSFLANMSHEIRTPLNSIIGFSELLLDKDFDADQRDEFAKMINSSGNGLLTIITDIMDLSKIEAGQVQINRESFSVLRLINDIKKEYAYKASEKGIELRLDPENSKDELFIESDKHKLRQVLINFVGNAIKFTEKGFIEIGFRTTLQQAQSAGSSPTGYVSEPGSTELSRSVELQFFVKDTGIGIPEEHYQQIFERFRQVESSNNRKYGGNGLGLAISKSLIELLGGKIGMNSEVGKGTTFYFTIPLKRY